MGIWGFWNLSSRSNLEMLSALSAAQSFFDLLGFIISLGANCCLFLPQRYLNFNIPRPVRQGAVSAQQIWYSSVLYTHPKSCFIPVPEVVFWYIHFFIVVGRKKHRQCYGWQEQSSTYIKTRSSLLGTIRFLEPVTVSLLVWRTIQKKKERKLC